ncbi:hypothetical protein AAC387_Pa01g2088 [Persea americana]
MYKNQLQELAQRSCFNLPSYACIREGPDHAPRFKATVNFNGEIFEGPSYCFTLRQAEHAAAEVALHTLSTRGPSRSLAARVLDETGVYKNLLQETAHRAGLNLPVYTTVRSGPGHLPVFTCTVELAGRSFTGEPAKTKKQAEKNAAMAAWSSLKRSPNFVSVSHTNKESESNEEQEQAFVARVLSNFRPKDGNKPFRQKDQQQLRRRVTLGYKENSSASPANTLHYQQSRCLDLLSDVSSVYPAQPHRQHNRFLVSHPTGSRILPPMSVFQQCSGSLQEPSSTEDNPSVYPSNRTIPVQVKRKSQDKMREVPPPLEEHQKDEEEWLGGKSDVGEEPIEKGPYMTNLGSALRPSSSNHRPVPISRTPNLNNQTQFRTMCSRPTSISLVPGPIQTMSTIPQMLNSGGFQLHGMAPAVQIRSVVPVCAAPPMRPQSNPPTAQKKEALASSSISPKAEEISATIPKLNRLHL